MSRQYQIQRMDFLLKMILSLINFQVMLIKRALFYKNKEISFKCHFQGTAPNNKGKILCKKVINKAVLIGIEGITK